MDHLVKHLWENNRDEIVSKSLLNCHCKGVHSIMLSECPEKTIRLYIAVVGNELYKNLPDNVKDGYEMSVGFHSHHCNITIHCIKGQLLNWLVAPCESGFELTKYKYHSKIKEGELSFENLGYEVLNTISEIRMVAGKSMHMKASDIHSVACLSNEVSAWFVYEGKEAKEYNSFCWSNADMKNQNFEGLYQKPTESEIKNLLEILYLL